MTVALMANLFRFGANASKDLVVVLVGIILAALEEEDATKAIPCVMLLKLSCVAATAERLSSRTISAATSISGCGEMFLLDNLTLAKSDAIVLPFAE
jgi:hypothetical protein